LREENPPKQQYKYQLFVDSLLLLEKCQTELAKLKEKAREQERVERTKKQHELVKRLLSKLSAYEVDVS
jgi:hypothetical protein